MVSYLVAKYQNFLELKARAERSGCGDDEVTAATDGDDSVWALVEVCVWRRS